MSSERPSETSPENTPEPRAPRRRALTWGAGALTFSVLTLGGLALSAPAGTGGSAPGTDAGTGASAGPAASVTSAVTVADDMTNVIEER
ncbi:hypothetical protein ACFRCR_13850 [Oerskovia sp. NPDC056781]|uniref:hypothetical protein n=1 Tax=Oerskovia sp. NPDC056781 TaxID=3345942 RepID=UPI00366B40DF